MTTEPVPGMGLIEYEVGKKFIQRHRCQCGSRLGMPWGGSYGVEGYFIRCMVDVSHVEYRQTKNTRFFKDAEGRLVEYDIMTQRPVAEPVTALAVIADPKEMELRVSQAWSTKMLAGDIYDKDLPSGLKEAIIQMAITHGLDPMLGEMAIIFNKPYPTIKAVRRKHAEAGHRPSIRYRLLTEDEKAEYSLADAWEEGDLAGYAVFTREDGSTVEAFGKVTKKQREAKNRKGDGLRNPVVADNPIELLHKRQEARGWEMAYGGLGMPLSAEVRGEVVEGNARELDNTALNNPVSAPTTETIPGPPQQAPESRQWDAGAKLGNCPEHSAMAWAPDKDGRIGHPTGTGKPWHFKDEEDAPVGEPTPLERKMNEMNVPWEKVKDKMVKEWGNNDTRLLTEEHSQWLIDWMDAGCPVQEPDSDRIGTS